MASAIVAPLEIPVMYTRLQIGRGTGCEVANDLEEESNVFDFLHNGQAAAGPAFQPYCAFFQ